MRKPGHKKLVSALDRAAHFCRANRGSDTSQGKIVDEILGPILWDYWRLRGLCADALDAMSECADGDTDTMARIRAALRDSSPVPEVFDPKNGGAH